MPPLIRPAVATDAPAIAAIYNPYITGTTISFEEVPVTAADMAQRIADVGQAGLPWLVLEENGRVRGYAYATRWRVRPAYRHSVESSVYLEQGASGQGWGRLLYDALIEQLRAGELHLVIGGIALPNERSVALHERLGFTKAAQFTEVGFKHGRWVDVGYWQLILLDQRL
jgi:phosphinothricin acetyltransferase